MIFPVFGIKCCIKRGNAIGDGNQIGPAVIMEKRMFLDENPLINSVCAPNDRNECLLTSKESEVLLHTDEVDVDEKWQADVLRSAWSGTFDLVADLDADGALVFKGHDDSTTYGAQASDVAEFVHCALTQTYSK